MAIASFGAARTFLYCQARVLERRLFAALFDSGSSAGVVAALHAYRNDDGGFGHGLEPDKRCPDSQPLDVEIAFQSLDAVGELAGPLVDAALDCLDRVSVDGGVSLVSRVALEYPRAEHWGDSALSPALNPTAGLVALCTKHRVEHPWLSRATQFCEARLEAGDWGDAHSLREVLSYAEQMARPDLVDGIGERLRPDLDSYKPDAHSAEYGVTPLHFAPHPDSPGARLFSQDQLNDHLDVLTEQQQGDGGWPVTWTPPSEAAALEWRGIETVRAVQVLMAYGRIHTDAA